jgi:hypothetical protein
MNLSDVQTAYRELSGKASDISRQLALAGIAFVWVFSGGAVSTGAAISIPGDLYRVGLALVVALSLDLLQYTWGAVAWGVFGRQQEKKLQADELVDNFLAPNWINYPSFVFFALKLISVGVAYLLLGIALQSRLH